MMKDQMLDRGAFARTLLIVGLLLVAVAMFLPASGVIKGLWQVVTGQEVDTGEDVAITDAIKSDSAASVPLGRRLFGALFADSTYDFYPVPAGWHRVTDRDVRDVTPVQAVYQQVAAGGFAPDASVTQKHLSQITHFASGKDAGQTFAEDTALYLAPTGGFIEARTNNVDLYIKPKGVPPETDEQALRRVFYNKDGVRMDEVAGRPVAFLPPAYSNDTRLRVSVMLTPTSRMTLEGFVSEAELETLIASLPQPFAPVTR